VPEEQRTWISIVRDNLERFIVTLGAFVVAVAVGFLSAVPILARVGAAVLALISALLLYLWLPKPLREWTVVMKISVAIPALLAVSVIVLGLSILREPLPPDPESSATVLVVDASSGMNERLADGKRKLDAALESARKAVNTSEEEQLGLVRIGIGRCGTKPASPLVDVGKETDDAILQELSDIRAAGKSNLGEVTASAVSLLSDFREKGHIVVIAGGLDECGSQIDVMEKALDRGVNIRMQFVGLGLTDDEKNAILSNPSANIVTRFAESESEATSEVTKAFLDARFGEEIRSLDGYVQGDARQALNSTIRAINSRDVKLAKEVHAQLTTLLGDGEQKFDSLLMQDLPQEAASLGELLRTQFRLLKDGSDALERAIEFDEDHPEDLGEDDLEERNELIGQINGQVGKYNENVPELTKRAEVFLSKVQPA
jgi:hypothetical protein